MMTPIDKDPDIDVITYSDESGIAFDPSPGTGSIYGDGRYGSGPYSSANTGGGIFTDPVVT